MLIQGFKDAFEAYKDEMLHDLGELIAINSEMGEAQPGMPFGKGPYDALQCYLKIADRMGLERDNVDNYAASVFLGKGAETVGVLAHLDVVPAGKGWDTDPFELVIEDGRMYGRGTTDDKGPAIAALYGLRIIRDLGLPLKRGIQIVVGTNEENGSGCMEYFVAHRPRPDLGFTPDAEYPLIHGEKGSYWAKTMFPKEDLPIISMSAGNAYNAVPEECEVVLDGRQIKLDELFAMTRSELNHGYAVEVIEEDDGTIKLITHGKAAHGSTPEKGFNAVVTAAEILCAVLGDKAGKLLHFVKDIIGRDTVGKTAGVYMQDADSGETSLNLGMLRYNENESWIGIDIRYPVTETPEHIEALYSAMAAKYGLTFETLHNSAPHFVPKDSELVTKLLNVYHEVSGDKDGQPYTIGGGTYAREIGKRFVGFGAEFPGVVSTMHQANENCTLEDFMTHCVICALAMYELAK